MESRPSHIRSQLSAHLRPRRTDSPRRARLENQVNNRHETIWTAKESPFYCFHITYHYLRHSLKAKIANFALYPPDYKFYEGRGVAHCILQMSCHVAGIKEAA